MSWLKQTINRSAIGPTILFAANLAIKWVYGTPPMQEDLYALVGMVLWLLGINRQPSERVPLRSPDGGS